MIERFPERYPGLLESSAGNTADSGARFDILPIASGASLRLTQQGLVGPHADAPGFFAALKRWWRELQLVPVPSAAGATLPFLGGWLLYLGYELAGEIEPRLRLPASMDPFLALAIRTPAAWIRDRARSQAYLVAESGAEQLLDDLVRDVGELGTPTAERGHPHFSVQEEDPARFLRAVAGALAYTAAGEVYQTNLSRQWVGRAERNADPVGIYKRLRTANPSPFAALLRHRDFALLSSSPERLVSIRGNIISTRPIAGTRPRGATAADDEALIRSLLENEKERAEHVMLIDLERNDLGRVCIGGSVKVDEYMTVETYAHVHHIVSNVSGLLRPEVSPVDAIMAMFPGGTITGCPKFRCMQIIAELEACGRGAYTGSLGYLNRDGSCDMNILIRTITADAGQISFRAGAGIVADSNAAQELAETRAKAEGLLRALEMRL